MQHYDDMPKIPTITAEEAMKLSWLAIEVDGVYRVMLDLTALWNAGRVQGIRKERARRKRRAQTIEQ